MSDIEENDYTYPAGETLARTLATYVSIVGTVGTAGYVDGDFSTIMTGTQRNTLRFMWKTIPLAAVTITPTGATRVELLPYLVDAIQADYVCEDDVYKIVRMLRKRISVLQNTANDERLKAMEAYKKMFEREKRMNQYHENPHR